MAVNKKRYLSILKFKAAELDAVRRLAANVWGKWNPLFELLPEDDELENGYWPSLFDRITRGIERSCTREGATIFIDFDRLDGLQLIGADNPVQQIIERVRELGLECVPVISLSSSQVILDGVRNAISDGGYELAVRIYLDDIAPTLSATISSLVAGAASTTAQTHLIVDCQYVDGTQVGLAVAGSSALLSQTLMPLTWRSVTLAGTAFPEVLGVPGSSVGEIPRAELELWTNVRALVEQGSFSLHFGDYTVTHPELVEFDPRTMQLSAKVVYTTEDSWLIFKGRSLKLHGGSQSHALCQQLVARPEFRPSASAGEVHIAACSQNQTGPGNPQTWKWVGTNQHITFVANQIANLP